MCQCYSRICKRVGVVPVERVVQLRSATYAALGLEATPWLQSLQAKLGTMPEEEASGDRLQVALAQLSQARRALVLASRCIGELEIFAARHEPDQARRELLISINDLRVPGRLGICEYCTADTKLTFYMNLSASRSKRR